MINVLLDNLPEEWVSEDGESYEIETDFAIGVQLCMIQEDKELSDAEKFTTMARLLFMDKIPETEAKISECINWFLSGWAHDNNPKKKKEPKRLMDFDIDQWRIYSGFLQHYRIDLMKEEMHFWRFMGLLSTLPECAYTRVIDIRSRKIKPDMDKEAKRNLMEAKEIYDLAMIRTAEEQEEDDDVFDLLGGNLTKSELERQRIEEFERYADIDDE